MKLRAEVIAIGDEITSGVRLDTNTQWISQRLGDIGIEVAFHSTVGDNLEDNIAVFRSAAQRAEIIVTTGGLGPTADDLTRHAIAKMAGVELTLDQPVLEHIKGMYANRSIEMPPNNEIQAWFPIGTQVIPNPEGTAPGIDFAGTQQADTTDSTQSSYRIIALPGVPVEMKQMWETVEPQLKSMVGDDSVIHHHTVHCFGAGESFIETQLPDLVKRGRDPSVGITASSATISLRVSTRGETVERCYEKMKPTLATIHDCLGDLVYGENGISLEEVVVEKLESLGKTISVTDFGLNGAVAQAIGSADKKKNVLGVCVSGLNAPSHSETEQNQSDLRVEVSAINREEQAIAERNSVYTVTITNQSGEATEKEFHYSGHSGWRESRAVKEVLNFIRLHLANQQIN